MIVSHNISPAISVIVPVYRAERYLSDCVDSILAQTFRDFELILVNDGSPDNSGAICDAYAEKDSRVKVIHKANGGASSARNVGVEVAVGKYIGWVDADDRILPNMYETLYQLAEQYSADIADSQHILINGKQSIRSGREESIVYGSGSFIQDQFFSAKMKPGLTTKIYKRGLWNGIRFPEGRKHQDCYVNMRFALMPLIYVRTSEPFYYYVVRDNSITTTYTLRELREAIYLYEYTMELAANTATTVRAKKYLVNDAINRLMGRYFEVSIGSNLDKQYVYNKYIRKVCGFTLLKYLIMAHLPFKTRISYSLLLLNLKSLQALLHKYLGKK